ncbi:MmcB family DNA repair protein [Rhodobacter sp.]
MDTLPNLPLDLPSERLPAMPGQRLARGVARGLRDLDFACVEELALASGLRVDLMALGPRGELWIIECKSCRADYRADRKWQGYLGYCDRFFWAVDADFPLDLLPGGTGLIMADAWGAEVLRMGPETPLPGARRKAVTQRFARHAALRLQGLRDPGPGRVSVENP